MNQVELFVGIDWATEVHEVWVEDRDGAEIASWRIQNTGRGLAELCDRLERLTDEARKQIAIAIEVPHGPVVETLLEREFAVFSVNPKQLDRFRDRFSLAGAKDDRLDARVLASSLRTDARLFRTVRIQPAELIELREWSRMRDELQEERHRLSNRVREHLRRYFPQWLDVESTVSAEWFMDAWEMIPTPMIALTIDEQSLYSLLRSRRIRKITAQEVLQTLREPAFVVAPGTVEAARAHIQMLVSRLRLVNQQVGRCDERLDQLLGSLSTGDDESEKCAHRDAAILRSIPGVGRVVLATVLAESPQAIEERDYHNLRALSGVAPITKRSGKRKHVLMRRACNPRLRDALYHWARVAAQRDPRSRARYAALRARGCSHGRALRTVGDRLLYVVCAMLRDGALFDADLVPK